MQNNFAYNIFLHKLDYTLFDKKMCYSESYGEIAKDLNFQRAIINDLENKLGKNNKNTLERKKFYTLIELEHLEFVQQLNKECKQGVNVILFFYSNKEEDLENSEKLGRLLDNVYDNHQQNLIIYSFDVNLDSALIKSLKKSYDIDKYNTIIVNEVKLTDIENVNDVEKYIK